jgi:hypothetical protein
MYAPTSIWFVSFTRATLRSAEFGFFGVDVYTRVHTPRRCGDLCSAGLEVLEATRFLPFRTNWLIVGKFSLRIGLTCHTDKPRARRRAHGTPRECEWQG